MLMAPEQAAKNPLMYNGELTDWQMVGGGGGGGGWNPGPWNPPVNNWGPHASDFSNIFLAPRRLAPNFGAKGTTSNTQPAAAAPAIAPIFFGGGMRGYFDDKGTKNPWIFNRNVEWPQNFSNPLIRM